MNFRMAKISQIKAKILEVKKVIEKNPQQKIDLKAVNEFLVDVLKEDPRYKSLGDEKLYKQLNATNFEKNKRVSFISIQNVICCVIPMHQFGRKG